MMGREVHENGRPIARIWPACWPDSHLVFASSPPDLLTALASDASGALRGGHDALVGHVDKESVINHANGVLEGFGGRLDVLDGLLEREIDDVVAVVCQA